MRDTSKDQKNDLEANNNHPSATPYASMGLVDPTTSGAAAAAPTKPPDGIVVTAAGEDSHIRSLSKGLTWRFVASSTTIVIVKIVTGETTTAFQIGFVEFFAKIAIYYLHERVWAKIKL